MPGELRWLRRAQDWIAVCCVLVLTILFFWKIGLTNLILVGLDVFTYFYPHKAYAAAMIRQGDLPLWNPYLFMGVPFLANIQTATLYPLNALLYWLPVPKMISYSIVLHVALGGTFTYFFSRRVLSLGAWGALIAAVTFALGGFLGAQVEHINQLSVLIWLPLILWLFYLSHTHRGLSYVLLTGVVVGIQFLGGHAQASYINLSALGCYALYLSVRQGSGGLRLQWRPRRTAHKVLRGMALFAVAALVGGGLAALQLLPTYELSSLSIRGGGLSYRQAVSFSLHPGALALSLLPGLSDTPFSEYVAYVGIIPLLLAGLGAWKRGSKHQAPFFIALTLLGVFLALGAYNPTYWVLYRVVPGFSSFRAPARWLYLYSLGVAVLAGLGAEELASHSVAQPLRSVLLRSRRRVALIGLTLLLIVVSLPMLELPSPRVIFAWLLLLAIGAGVIWFGHLRQRGVRYLGVVTLLVVGELFFASRYLAYNDATAAEAFSSMRSPAAYLSTDESVHRFLSFSDGSYDPGDLYEIQRIFAGELSEQALYDYLVATKQKEIITPNLSLLYGLQSVDGYDGGVLPLARYVDLERLLVPEGETSPDGRLQGRIAEIPSGWVLNMLNVKYVITDKVYDVWVDGVFYDLGHRAVLDAKNSTQLLLGDLPSFPSTALGIVSYLTDGGGLEQGSPVAEITISDGDGHEYSRQLRVGEETAEGEYEAGFRRHDPARVVGHWRGNPGGNDYHTVFTWDGPIYPRQIQVRYLADEGQLRLRGMTLIDERTGAHQTLIVSTEGRYRLAHSGNVKIYENLDVLPRAFVVHRARLIHDDERVIAAMQAESFAPDEEAILSTEGPGVTSDGEATEDEVSILSYEPERVMIEADLESPGYLVLTDAYYPGWRALVDGRPVDILRADYYFRSVYLPEGEHEVQFIYDPASFRVGLVVSLASLSLVSGVLGWAWLRGKRSGRRRMS